MTREQKEKAIYKWAFGNWQFLECLKADWNFIYREIIEKGYFLEDLTDLDIDLIYEWGYGRF